MLPSQININFRKDIKRAYEYMRALGATGERVAQYAKQGIDLSVWFRIYCLGR